MPLVLESAGGSLRLDTDENGWCRVHLEQDGRSIELGADSERVIRARLTRAVVDPLSGATARTLGGSAAHWALSLAERHASIYVADAGASRRLFFQDAQGALFATLDLTEGDRLAWAHALRSPR